MQPSSSSTTYNSFDESDEIRLLTLLPGSKEDPICCTLNHARLKNKPKYEALSYEWGPLGRNFLRKEVTVDGLKRDVRENLGYALWHLRLANEPRILWVDALCINQLDERERCHQVNQMGLIYSNASNTCVWLGMPEYLGMRLFQVLKQDFSTSEFPLSAGRFQVNWDDYMDAVMWHELDLLCNMKYWGRLWIIQEVVLAARVQLYLGDEVLP